MHRTWLEAETVPELADDCHKSLRLLLADRGKTRGSKTPALRR
jgi:hypothetical protein